MQETAVCPDTFAILSATTSTGNAALGSNVVRIIASGDCFLKFGNSSVVAAVTDMKLLANQPEYFNMGQTGYTHVAAITASGTSAVNISACR